MDEDRSLDDAVVVAAGGNGKGDFPTVHALLEAALKRLPEAGLRVVKRSGWWRSAAWPDPTQPEYLNAVILVETSLSADELLSALLALEREFGRTRSIANAARTLDLDLIAFGRQVSDQPGLTLPHPRAHLRRFVMGPLAEIAPCWRHPVSGETAAALAASAEVGADTEPVSQSAGRSS